MTFIYLLQYDKYLRQKQSTISFGATGSSLIVFVRTCTWHARHAPVPLPVYLTKRCVIFSKNQQSAHILLYNDKFTI
jgi:hypothetical protein